MVEPVTSPADSGSSNSLTALNDRSDASVLKRVALTGLAHARPTRAAGGQGAGVVLRVTPHGDAATRILNRAGTDILLPVATAP